VYSIHHTTMTTYYQANNNTETVSLVNTSISKVDSNEASLSSPTAAVASWKKKVAVVISAVAVVCVGGVGLVGMSTDGKQPGRKSLFGSSILRKDAGLCPDDDDWDPTDQPSIDGCKTGICPDDDDWDPTTDDVYECRQLNHCPNLYTYCDNQKCTNDSDCDPKLEDDYFKNPTMTCLAGQCYQDVYPQCAEIKVGHRHHHGKYGVDCGYEPFTITRH